MVKTTAATQLTTGQHDVLLAGLAYGLVHHMLVAEPTHVADGGLGQLLVAKSTHVADGGLAGSAPSSKAETCC